MLGPALGPVSRVALLLASLLVAGCAGEPLGSATPTPVEPPTRATGERAPLLLLREWDWLNASDDAPAVLASFGGHCAPAWYTTEPPAFTIRHFGGPRASNDTPEAALIRDFRDSPRPEKAVTTSADRIAFEAGSSFAIASPYEMRNASVILAWARHAGNGTFVVERGEERHELAPGDRTSFHAAYDFELDGHRYRGEHVLEFTSLGPAAVSHEEVGFCL